MTTPLSQLKGNAVAGYIRTVTAKTSDYTLIGAAANSDSGKIFTTTGASGEVIFTLPTATVGLEYEFVVDAAQYLRIKASGTDIIVTESTSFGDVVPTAAGGYIRSNNRYYSMRVFCFASGKWASKGAYPGGVGANNWQIDS